MGRFRTISTELALAALALSPQAVRSQNQNARSTADAHQAHQSKSFIDYALGKINPEDKAYGSRLDHARRTFIEHTVDDLYFWSNVLTLGSLVGVTALLLLHLRGAQKREIIAASVIAQLWNGRVSDRTEIDQRTERYNQLVEVHNAEAEQRLMPRLQKPDSDKKVATRIQRSIGELAEKPKEVPATLQSERSLAATVPTIQPPDDSDTVGLQQENLLLKRQVEAIKNTEQNLKVRLNQVTSQLEQERMRNGALKGA
jgi:hypothetical protein